jgi:hypothetical protein
MRIAESARVLKAFENPMSDIADPELIIHGAATP